MSVEIRTIVLACLHSYFGKPVFVTENPLKQSFFFSCQAHPCLYCEGEGNSRTADYKTSSKKYEYSTGVFYNWDGNQVSINLTSQHILTA